MKKLLLGFCLSFSIQSFTCLLGPEDFNPILVEQLVEDLEAKIPSPPKQALNEALWSAVKQANISDLVAAFRLNSDVNARDESGLTPLMYASNRCLVNVAKFLVHHRADIDAESEDEIKKTALTFAMASGCDQIVKLLQTRVKDAQPYENTLSFSPKHPARLPVIQGLSGPGYFSSTNMALSRHVKAELKELFSNDGRGLPDCNSDGDAHAEATSANWQMLVESFSYRPAVFSKLPNHRMSLPQGIKNLVLEVIAYLDEGEYMLDITLYDDVGKWVRDQEKMLKASVKSVVAILDMPPIFWHADKFGQHSMNHNYDWLYFTVLEACGLFQENNKLALGRLAKLDIVPSMKISDSTASAQAASNDQVLTIENIDGISGAGYFVDQNHEIDGQCIVHKRFKLQTAMCNFSPDGKKLNHSFFNAGRQLTNANNCNSPVYERPTRKTVVVRIKKIYQ